MRCCLNFFSSRFQYGVSNFFSKYHLTLAFCHLPHNEMPIVDQYYMLTGVSSHIFLQISYLKVFKPLSQYPFSCFTDHVDNKLFTTLWPTELGSNSINGELMCQNMVHFIWSIITNYNLPVIILACNIITRILKEFLMCNSSFSLRNLYLIPYYISYIFACIHEKGLYGWDNPLTSKVTYSTCIYNLSFLV